MTAVNSIRLSEDSPFRKADQVPMPEDLAIGVQTEGQKDSSDDEECGESPKSRELSRQINSHVVVLNDEQSRIGAFVSEQIAQPMVTSDPPPSNPPTNQEAPVMNPTAIVTPTI